MSILVTGAVPAAAEDAIRVGGDLRFEGGPDTVLTVGDGRRFHDTLELRAGGAVINELDIEDYVAGVAEMPSRWPAAALEAQAVAARTYVWWHVEQGTYDGYDICASTACQVFRGADVVLDDGERWAAAVEATQGEVLLDGDGEPILARYFSTSGGRTYANEDVFPATGPRPYLESMEDPYDAVSPYHRWTVHFTRDEFNEILGRGERLAAAVPVAGVERLGDVDDQAAEILVTGADGSEVTLGAVELRDFLSRVAPARFEDRFPGRRADGLRPLPSTVPSSRFTVELTDDEVVLHGRGWGHGVGMGQYGARGRAAGGASYDEILAAYYGGLEPTTSPELPERVRVGLEIGAATTIAGDRPVTIVADGEVVVPRALGSWQVTPDGSGWRLTPPAGTDEELVVTPTREATELAAVTDAVTVEAEVNKPVELRLEVHDRAGELLVARELGTAEAGTHAATWRFTDDEGTLVPPGEYRLTLRAEDADGTQAGAPVTVTVPVANADDERGTGERSSADTTDPLLILILVAAVALPTALAIVVLVHRKART